MSPVERALVACACAVSMAAASSAQESRAAESRAADDPAARAKADIRSALLKERQIGLEAAVAEMTDPSRTRRENAAAYAAALLELTTSEAIRLRVEELKAQDETFKKTGWRQYTFGLNAAEQLRSHLVYYLGAVPIAADAVEALAPAIRLLDSDEAEEIGAGLRIVRRVRAPQADDLLRAATTRFEGKRGVLKDAVVEIGARGLKDQAPRIRELCVHHGPSVRDAARESARLLGLTELPDPAVSAAFGGRLDRELRRFAAATEPVVPVGARWVRIDPLPPKPPPSTDPESGNTVFRIEDYVPEEDRSVRFGRVLSEASGSVEVLDWRGVAVVLAANSPRVAKAAAGDAVDALITARERWARDRDESQRSTGERTAFERRPGMVVPQEWEATSADLLVGAWAYVEGELEAAARCLFPLLASQDDEDRMFAIVRESLAVGIEERMLAEFTETGNYAASIRYARRLTSPTFDGFYHQGLARELAAQLERRGGDFADLELPTRAEWNLLRQKLPRVDQVAFLAARLRLVACNQNSIPGGCDYSSESQYQGRAAALVPSAGGSTAKHAINPFNELHDMKLTPAEAVGLLPTLESDDFMRGFDRFRFLPQQPRTLHRAAWAAGLIVDDVLGSAAVRFELLTPDAADARAKHVADLRKRMTESK